MGEMVSVTESTNELFGDYVELDCPFMHSAALWKNEKCWALTRADAIDQEVPYVTHDLLFRAFRAASQKALGGRTLILPGRSRGHTSNPLPLGPGRTGLPFWPKQCRDHPEHR